MGDSGFEEEWELGADEQMGLSWAQSYKRSLLACALKLDCLFLFLYEAAEEEAC